MKVSAKTQKQLDDALNRVIAQCPSMKQAAVLSDVYFTVNATTGELIAHDDDDHELCRQVVSEWKTPDGELDMQRVQAELQECISNKHERIEEINFLRPFSFVLVDDERETIADLYLVDDDTMLIPGELMEGLEDDLNAFLKELMEE